MKLVATKVFRYRADFTYFMKGFRIRRRERFIVMGCTIAYVAIHHDLMPIVPEAGFLEFTEIMIFVISESDEVLPSIFCP
jgi:hypothetical protein